jgi:hypothetical protein
MKSFLFLPVLFVMVTLSSCHYSNEYKVVKAGNEFSMSVPPWMKEDKELKPGALFQYASHYRNFYAIGTAETRDTMKTIGEVMTANLKVLRNAMSNAVISDSSDVMIDSLKGIRSEIFGKMNNENIYFSEVVLESPTKLYHLSVWTRGEDRKLRYKDDINKILNSFKR